MGSTRPSPSTSSAFDVLTLAARGCVTYRRERVRNYPDYLEIDKAVPYLSCL